MADRAGIMVWDEIPMYRMSDQALNMKSVRDKGLTDIQEMILRDQNHPSVLTWSIGNENPSQPGFGQTRYIEAAHTLVNQMDPTRLLAFDIAGYPSTPKIARVQVHNGARDQRLLRLVPRAERPARGPQRPRALPRPDAPVLSAPGAVRHRVRRRVQPPRRGGREGHLRVPGRLARVPEQRVRLEVVPERRDRLDPARLQGAPGLGRRQPGVRRALQPEGPDGPERQSEAGLSAAPADLPERAACRRRPPQGGRHGRSGQPAGRRAPASEAE